MGLNYAAVSGNLTRDPEMRSTPGGMAILQIGIAFNDRRKNPQTGQWEDVPNFIDGVLFGNRAEAMSRILTKGMHVSVQGKLRWSSWEKGGERRSKIELIIDEIDLMSPRQDNGGGYQRAPQMPAQAYQTPQNAPQMPQGYANPPQQQMAPQMPSQAPVAPQGYGYQQQAPVQQELYSEDIPFASPYDL